MIRTYFKRMRPLWQPPHAHRGVDRERTVSFLELFYDLVYVVLIAAVAHNLAGHMNWVSVGEFFVVFSLVWIAWLNGSAEYDLHGREYILTRVFTFVQMLLVALLAFYASWGKDGRDEFAIVYGVFCGVLAWLWFTAHLQADERHKRTFRLYLALTLLSAASVVGSVFVPLVAQLWVWGITALVWICTSFFIFRASLSGPGEVVLVSESLVERFGLFTIIVLGEVVVGVVDGISASAHNLQTVTTGMLALGIGFGLWWNYFDLTGRRLPRQDRTGLPIWIILHLPLTLSIAAAGAAMVSVIEHAGDLRAPEIATWVLNGSVAISLLTIAVIVPTLQDWSRYRSIFLVTSILMAILAIGIVPLSLLRPGPMALVSMLLGVLALVWAIAVIRWLMTEGETATS